MPVIFDKEEYLNTREAQDFLGNISVQTLGNYVRQNKIKVYKRELTGNLSWYKTAELRKLLEFKPVEKTAE